MGDDNSNESRVDGPESGGQLVLSAARLLQNGLDQLRAGCDCLRGEPSDVELRRALREVASGIELVLKSFLAAEHWALIFEEPAAASQAAFRAGDIQSVGFAACVERLQSITSIRVTDRQKKDLGRMRNKRNQMEHLGLLDNVLAVRAAIGGSLHAVASLVKQASETGLLVGADKALHTTLAVELSDLDDFVKARWKEIQRVVPADSETCPACGQRAAEHDGDWSCHFCGTTSVPKDVAEYFMENDLGLSAYSIIKDGGEWPLYQCPSCDEEALVGVDDDGLRCFACGDTFAPSALAWCSDCNRPLVDDGETLVCSDCFSYKVNRDD